MSAPAVVGPQLWEQADVRVVAVHHGRPGTGPTIVTPAPRAVWRHIVATDPEALPEQTPEWLDAICSTGAFADASRLYVFADGRRFVFPAVRRRGPRGLGGWLLSFPPAWGMGGLVGVGIDDAVVRSVVSDLQSLGLQRLWVRPNPLAAGHWDAAAADAALVIPRRGHIVDLSGGIAAVESRMHRGTRKYIRRAERLGVRVDVTRGGAGLDAYYRLYLASIDRWAARQHEPLPLARWRGRLRDPLSKLQAMARHLGPSFVLALAYVDEEPVYGSIMLLGRTAHVTRSAMDVDRVGPTKAGTLIHQAFLRLACAEGCTWYHLGETGSSESLAQFKEGFGAVAYDYAEYRFEALPYTRIDQTARRVIKRAIGFRDH